MRKVYDTPLVQLQAVGDWSADIDAVVLYRPLQPFPSSNWDWIGLYKVGSSPSAVCIFCLGVCLTFNTSDVQVGFSSFSDYVTYTWVKDDEVVFNEEEIQVVGPVRNITVFTHQDSAEDLYWSLPVGVC